MNVLVVNTGSSSVKFEIIETSLEAIEKDSETKLCRGLIDKIGTEASTVTLRITGRPDYITTPQIPKQSDAVRYMLKIITDPDHGCLKSIAEIQAVGHRIVHGGEFFSQSVMLNADVAQKIKDCIELAPLHNPHNLRGYELMLEALPNVPHAAVFDTSFHQTMPAHAYLYALPYSLYQKYKIRRYGFHGTSHRYMIFTLEKRILKRPRASFKAITVHLGNGCSVAAVDGGRSQDTSMGFTPLEGLIMGTRCGDIDPAAVLYLMAKEEMSLNEMSTIMNKSSGLAGLSGLSNDVRELTVEMKRGNARAEIALRAFSYRVRKYIGAYHAALCGGQNICFAGGIGENSPLIREMILENLAPLGIILDHERNNSCPKSGGEISADGSPVRVFVIPTDEELVIARDTVRCIAGTIRDT